VLAGTARRTAKVVASRAEDVADALARDGSVLTKWRPGPYGRINPAMDDKTESAASSQ